MTYYSRLSDVLQNVVEHFIEGIIKLARDSVDLELLADDFIFKFINPEVEFADVHLSILRTSFSLLKSDVDLLDLVLIFLLPPSGLLLRHLQLLLVLTDSLEFIFDHRDTSFCIFHTFISALEFILHH